MSSIDHRIVEMKFNNGQFQKGIEQSTESLMQLEQALNIERSTGSLDAIASKISALGVMGATGLSRLANAAIDAGKSIYDATVGQIVSGGEKRSQNFAQATFQLRGLGVVGEDLEKVMAAANYAVADTAYGLDEAAVAASSFVASNVDIDKLPGSLRAISGVAAMTGRSFGDISQIFTTVAGNGRLMASELNRIGASGVNAAAKIGEYLGVTETEVREMTSQGKISFEMFAEAMDSAFGEHATKANELYTGSLSNVRAALSRIGEPLADGKFERMRLIFNSLRPVINNVNKSLRPLLETIKQHNIDFGQKMAGYLDKIAASPAWKQITASFRTLGKIMDDIREIGDKFATIIGEVLREAFGKADKGASGLNKTVGKASGFFTRLFGAIAKGIKSFSDFIERVKNSERAMNIFRTVMTAIVQPISTVWTILQGLGRIMVAVLDVFFELGAALWQLIRPMGSFEVSSADAVSSMQDFFSMIREGVDRYVPIAVEWINKFRDAIHDLRTGGSSGVEWIDKIYETIMNFKDLSKEKIPEILKKIKDGFVDFIKDFDFGEFIRGIMDALSNIDFKFHPDIQIDPGSVVGPGSPLDNIVSKIQEFVKNVKDIFGGLGEGVKDASKDFKLEHLMAGINSGIMVAGIVGIVRTFKDFVKTNKSFLSAITDISGAFKRVGNSIGGYFDALTKGVKQDIILKIAFSIAILAGSLWLLAQLDPARLWGAVGAIAVLSLVLAGLGKVLTTVLTEKEIASLASLSGFMISIAFAVGILAASVWLLAQLNIGQLIAGTLSLIAVMVALAFAAKYLSKYNAGLIKSAFAVGILAVSLAMLAGTIWLFSMIPTDNVVKGSIIIVGALAAIALFGAAVSKTSGQLIKAAFAIGLLAASLLVMAGVVWLFSIIPMETVISGIIKFSFVLGALIGVALVLNSIKGPLLQAALAVGVLALSLIAIAAAFMLLNMVNMDDLFGKAMIMLLVIGALALISNIMGSIGIAGAFALVIMSTSLLVLAAALWVIQGIDIELIKNALLGLVIVILALGVAAIVMQTFALGAIVFAAVLIAFGLAAILFAAAIFIAVLAVSALAVSLPLLGVALLIFGEQASQIMEYVGPLWAVIALLAGFGLAATIAGLGLIVLGAGLVVLGIGLLMLVFLAPMAGLALLSLYMYIQQVGEGFILMAAAGLALAVLGAGLVVLGVGLALAAVGVTLFGLAIIVLAAGMLMFASSAGSMVGAALQLGAAAAILAALSPLLVVAGVAIAAFGAGALVAAVGILLLGAAMVVLGAGLALISGVGASASAALLVLGGALVQLAGQAIPIGVAAAALTVFGAAALVAGAGSVLLGAGLILMGTGLVMVSAFATTAGAALDMVSQSISKNLTMIPMVMQLAAAFGMFGVAAATAAAGAMAAGAGVSILGLALTLVASMSKSAAEGVQLLATIMSTVATATSTASSTMGNAFMSLGSIIAAASAIVGASIRAMMQVIVSSMLAGVPVIVGAIKTIVAAIITGFTTAAAAIGPAGIAMVTTLAAILIGSVGLFSPIGIAMGMAFVAGYLSTLGLSTAAAIMIVQMVIVSLRTGIPLAKAVGLQTGQAYALGLRASMPLAMSAGIAAGNAFVNAVRAASSGAYSAGYSAGASVAQGMAAGIYNNIGSVVSAAYSLAAAVPAEVKQLLAIRSPSRVAAELGGYFGEGLVIGLDRSERGVSKASGNLAESTLQSFRDALVESSIADSMDFNPTIRPVMDLSDIYARTGELDSLFGDRVSGSPIYDAASSIATSQAERSENGYMSFGAGGVTFVQNNYSPKALPRAEIYRDTKNLISMEVK